MPSIPASEEEIGALRDSYLEHLELFADVANAVHRVLNESASALIVIRNHLRDGGRVSDFSDLMNPAPMRAALSSALTDFERTRHESQRRMFLLLRAEGKTPAEIARIFGISRQLVSRIINEAPPTSPPTDPSERRQPGSPGSSLRAPGPSRPPEPEA